MNISFCYWNSRFNASGENSLRHCKAQKRSLSSNKMWTGPRMQRGVIGNKPSYRLRVDDGPVNLSVRGRSLQKSPDINKIGFARLLAQSLDPLEILVVGSRMPAYIIGTCCQIFLYF